MDRVDGCMGWLDGRVGWWVRVGGMMDRVGGCMSWVDGCTDRLGMKRVGGTRWSVGTWVGWTDASDGLSVRRYGAPGGLKNSVSGSGGWMRGWMDRPVDVWMVERIIKTRCTGVWVCFTEEWIVRGNWRTGVH